MVRIKEKESDKIKEIDINYKIKKVKDILLKAGYNPEEYLISKKGEIIPDEEEIKNEDEIEIIKIVSGG